MNNAALAQYDSAVNKAAERPDLVQYNQHAGAGRQQSGQYLCQYSLMLQVNSRSGLIQNQEIGITGKRPGNQHSLLLAA